MLVRRAICARTLTWRPGGSPSVAPSRASPKRSTTTLCEASRRATTGNARHLSGSITRADKDALKDGILRGLIGEREIEEIRRSEDPGHALADSLAGAEQQQRRSARRPTQGRRKARVFGFLFLFFACFASIRVFPVRNRTERFAK